MQNRTDPMRHRSRFPVSWPVQYGNGAFLAEGTVLNLTSLGWRVAGTMPVAPGMELTLQVSIPERPTPLYISRATVLCVNHHEFAIEVHEMTPHDRAWVTEFLCNKSRLTRMSGSTRQQIFIQTRDDMSHEKASHPQSVAPLGEDLLHQFCSLDPATTDGSDNGQWDSTVESHESQAHPHSRHTPELLLDETHRLVRRMVALNTARSQRGQNPIPNN